MWEKTAARRLFKELALDPNDQRIVRVLNAEELEPGEAERMLYGPPAVSSVPALPHGREPADGEITNGVHTGTPREQGDTATEAGGGQQAAAGAESADTSAAAPDDDPEPQLEIASQPGTAKAPSVAQARKVVLTWGVNKGKTLGEAAAADGAVTYMGWCLRNLGRFDPDTGAAIQVVAKSDVPDAWAKHVEKREAAS